MKFIPGTKFINNTRKNTRHFQSGVLHVLNNVSFNKEDNTFTYSFKLPQKNEFKEVKFESIEQADNYLQTIILN